MIEIDELETIVGSQKMKIMILTIVFSELKMLIKKTPEAAVKKIDIYLNKLKKQEEELKNGKD